MPGPSCFNSVSPPENSALSINFTTILSASQAIHVYRDPSGSSRCLLRASTFSGLFRVSLAPISLFASPQNVTFLLSQSTRPVYLCLWINSCLKEMKREGWSCSPSCAGEHNSLEETRLPTKLCSLQGAEGWSISWVETKHAWNSSTSESEAGGLLWVWVSVDSMARSCLKNK